MTTDQAARLHSNHFTIRNHSLGVGAGCTRESPDCLRYSCMPIGLL